MSVFVVTGRAGSLSWPAKVFAHEFAAHIWKQVAEVAAKSCNRDVITVSWTPEYQALPDMGKREVDDALTLPFRSLDPDCDFPPEQWVNITYEVKRVALHD